jgi:hypothetical protein
MKTLRHLFLFVIFAVIFSLTSFSQVSVQFPTVTGGYGAYTLTQSGNMVYSSSCSLYTSANLSSKWGYITSIKWKGYGSIAYNLISVNANLANTTDASIATGKNESYYRTPSATVTGPYHITDNTLALGTTGAWVGFSGLSFLLNSGQNMYVTFHCYANPANYAYFAGTGTANCGAWGAMSDNGNPSIPIPAQSGGLRPDITVVFGAPTISIPATVNVPCSGSTSITVTASTLTTSYQWQYSAIAGGPYTNVVNGTPSGAVYTNATTNSLGVSGINVGGNYYYKCIAYNGNATSTTSATYTTLNLATCCVAPASVAIAGYTTPVCSGTNPGTITATPNGGSGDPYTYLWYANGVSTGITTQTYDPGTLSGNTHIICAVSTGTGCVTGSTNELIQVYQLPTVTVDANPPAYCNGQSSLLNASGASDYLWSPANDLSSTTGYTITASPTTTTTYTVVGTDDHMCSNTFSTTITVYNYPAPPTVEVVDNCGSSTLSTTDYTGTLLWNTTETTPSITVASSGDYTVTQTVNGCTSVQGSGTTAPKTIPPPPVVIVTDNCGSSVLTASNYSGTLLWNTSQTSASINVTSAGVYTVNQTENGCVSANGSGTASPKAIPPMPTVNVFDQCGSSILTASDFTGTLMWSTTESTTSITVTSAGNYTVNQTEGGCISPNANATAAPQDVPPMPTVNVSDNCGYSVLTASDFTGSLLWNTTETTPSITVAYAGNFTVTQTVNGCSSMEGIGNAAPNSFPVVSLGPDFIICANQSVSLSVSNTGCTYYWMPGGETTQNITVDSLGIGLGPHIFSVIVMTTNFCPDTDSIVVTIDACTGIASNKDAISFSISPNPSDGIFLLGIEGMKEAANLSIYTASGQIVYSEKIENQTDFNKEIDLASYPKGMYFLRVYSNGFSHLEKIIIK